LGFKKWWPVGPPLLKIWWPYKKSGGPKIRHILNTRLEIGLMKVVAGRATTSVNLVAKSQIWWPVSITQSKTIMRQKSILFSIPNVIYLEGIKIYFKLIIIN